MEEQREKNHTKYPFPFYFLVDQEIIQLHIFHTINATDVINAELSRSFPPGTPPWPFS